MSLIDRLPDELYSYILWLSSGPFDLDTHNKQSNVNIEISFYRHKKNDGDFTQCFYLYFIENYEKSPGLELNGDHYLYANRIPRLWDCY